MSQLLDHLNTNELWPRFQSTYRACHSTETALLRVLNDLLTASDDGKVSLLSLLDLSAAFDSIDHDSLFNRLEHVFGIQNSALSFFRSYLTERKQMVSILDTVQILPLSFMAYLRAQFSVPFCFYSTHNHSHRSLIDTQFPTVNFPMIASYMIQFHVNNLTLCLVTCSHV